MDKNQKLEKIRNYLLSTPEGATPKMIATATTINANTVKSILPKMANVKSFTRGWYKVENRGDGTPRDELLSWTFHNLILSVQLPNQTRPHHEEEHDLGLIKATLTISGTARATLRVAADNPLNVSSICMVYGFFRELLNKHAGYAPSIHEVVINTIEFNKDYTHLRLDGVKSITLDNLITHFKVYQKQLALRKEHKTKHRFTAGTIVDMLTQNPNDLELASRLEAQGKQLRRLLETTAKNTQLTMALIRRLDNETHN